MLKEMIYYHFGKIKSLIFHTYPHWLSKYELFQQVARVVNDRLVQQEEWLNCGCNFVFKQPF